MQWSRWIALYWEMVRPIALILGAAALVTALPAASRPAHARRPAAHAANPKAAPQPDTDAPDRPAKPAQSSSALPLSGLLAASEDDARQRLGAPDLVRAEGQGSMWTYRMDDCALFLFFKGPEGQPMRVSGAATGPRRRGEPPATVEACIAEAVSAQASSKPSARARSAG